MIVTVIHSDVENLFWRHLGGLVECLTFGFRLGNDLGIVGSDPESDSALSRGSS